MFGRLKRLARISLAHLDREMPVNDWKNLNDPVGMNAVFPDNEWALETPMKNLKENRDWIHLFACDPAAYSRFELFFERLENQVAVIWAKIKIKGRGFILKETLYKDESTDQVYRAGGVILECTGPMRFWRVSVNAIFEAIGKNEKQKELHVCVRGRASMTGHTFEMPAQISPNFIARKYTEMNGEEFEDKAEQQIKKSCSKLQAYFQPICLFTEIVVGSERVEAVMFGTRLKFVGNSDLLEGTRHILGYTDNGVTFGLFESTDGKCFGFSSSPDKFLQPVVKGKFTGIASRDTNLPKEFTYDAGNVNHKVMIDVALPTPVSTLNMAERDKWVLEEVKGSLQLGEESYKLDGTAFKIRGRYKFPQTKVQLLKKIQFSVSKIDQLVMNTKSAECRNPAIVGTKAASIAVLTELAAHLKTFTVPPAVVLTLQSYELFMGLPQVKAAMLEFHKQSKDVDELKLEAACKKCFDTVSKVPLPEKLISQLVKSLEEQFGENWESNRYAVRSSNIGETLEDVSRGQKYSLLGTKSKTEIIGAIVKCWAHQFSGPAVVQKRKFGQAVNGPMAVVIQHIIEPDCAGTALTCNPITLSPAETLIAANFGFGESVSTAIVEPDMFVLNMIESCPVIASKKFGSKEKKTQLSDIDQGTEQILVSEEDASDFCIVDAKVIEIASIAQQLTAVSDSPRDIDWAVADGKVFLLNSRPVAAFYEESYFEIKNDMNSALYTNRDILSRAGVEELLPGAFSPLATSLLQRVLYNPYAKTKLLKQGASLDRSQYTYEGISVIGRRSFINFSTCPISCFVANSSVCLESKDVCDKDDQKKKLNKNIKVLKAICSNASQQKLRNTIRESKSIAEKTLLEFPSGADACTLLDSILAQLNNFTDVIDALMIGQLPPGVLNMFALDVLSKSQEGNSDLQAAKLLLSQLIRSNYELEGATIAEELVDLAAVIKKNTKFGKTFADMTVTEAQKTLEKDESEAGRTFRNIRSKHGHRGSKEFDFLEKTWDLDSTILVQALQQSVRCTDLKKQREDPAITIEQLPSQPSFMMARKLKGLVARIKYATFAQEAIKSAVIKRLHQLRAALRRLGKKMLSEGRIPNADLVFFFSLDELHRVLRTRNAVLVKRAIRRQGMHAILDRQRFPVVCHGFPQPITSKVTIPGDSVNGAPVSEGSAEGPARVIYDFHAEAHTIQKGDIVVTGATNIGWAAYMHLLGGLVTEVGDVLSQGAIVAREYGIPAVLNVRGVLDFFKSGDNIALNGNTGLVSKVAAPRKIGNGMATNGHAWSRNGY